jgi:hypothetical protein
MKEKIFEAKIATANRTNDFLGKIEKINQVPKVLRGKVNGIIKGRFIASGHLIPGDRLFGLRTTRCNYQDCGPWRNV